MARWSVNQAELRLGEVLAGASTEPQVIEQDSRDVAVVVQMEEYRALQRARDAAEPRRRVGEFLKLSREIGQQGGAELPSVRGSHREIPFGDEGEY